MCLTFGSTNLATASTTTYSLLAGTANSQFPLTNIKHPFTTKVFRSAGNTIEVMIDTKTSTTKNMFAIVGSSIDGLGFTSISIYGSNTTNFSASVQIPIDVNSIYNFGFKKFSDVSFRYWKVSLTGNGSYAEISNIFLGEQFGLTTNTLSISGFEFFNTDNTKVSRNSYGQEFITTYNKIKTVKGNIDYINREEFDLLNYLYNTHGVREPLWMIYDENDSTAIDGKYIFSGYYKFSKSPGFKAVGGQLWNSALVFKEVT